MEAAGGHLEVMPPLPEGAFKVLGGVTPSAVWLLSGAGRGMGNLIVIVRTLVHGT
jgi:hypothetical protein